MTVLCFIDTETTSLGPDRLVWEIAGIRRVYEDGQPDDEEWQAFVNHDPTGPVLSEEAAAYWVLQMTHGAVLVGSNPAFDAQALAALLRRHGYIESWHYAVRDIVPLAAGYILGHHQTVESWRSEDLSRAVGVNPDDYDRHTALGDCLWARAVYDAITGEGAS